MTRTAVLAGLGAWAPPRVVTNDEVASRIAETDEWIRTRTGIGARRVAAPEMSTRDIAVQAGTRALRSSKLTTVDHLVLATTTPDQVIPATAPSVATEMGLTGVAAFDLNAACAGFVYGLGVATGLITSGVADSVLLIAVDVLSTITNPNDRMTAPLFGDGAGAVVLRAGEQGEPGVFAGFDLHSSGEHADLINVPAGIRTYSMPDAVAEETDRYIYMAGKEVFLAAVANMSSSSRTALARAGHVIGDVDRVVGHQANIRILHAVAKQLDLPQDRLVTNIERFGNTSAASIPLALVDGVTSGALQPGHLVLMTAFGAGFTWGSTTVRWPDLAVEPVD
ncbi:beta-ketoacyl-ACP synthase III [Saccharopolyspora spinosa]|uniref:Beta-ketoacyl-[acyl-carrier-protein] synthase III n=1 Tax=Saccharopolyspora spinosa TaxID=60894 RepID=A0A2N3Y551_SACSN|nr:beta-ketoacyl-ACP synthase III [Saccharopolyspora spinosa]PKW17971.1 3-oxoacyl-[acyl-carrier-protein] synthase-3 [Saccharopolyspora spinosa]